MPSFSPIARPSETPTMVMPRIKLFTSFAISPDPGFPQWKKFFPIPESTYFAVSNCAASPPTMNVRVPLCAPVIPPDIGVSKKTRSLLAASALNSAEAIGLIVLVSQMYVPFLALSKIPPSCLRAAATCSVFGKAVMIKSTSETHSFNDVLTMMPASAASFLAFSPISNP